MKRNVSKNIVGNWETTTTILVEGNIQGKIENFFGSCKSDEFTNKDFVKFFHIFRLCFSRDSYRHYAKNNIIPKPIQKNHRSNHYYTRDHMIMFLSMQILNTCIPTQKVKEVIVQLDLNKLCNAEKFIASLDKAVKSKEEINLKKISDKIERLARGIAYYHRGTRDAIGILKLLE